MSRQKMREEGEEEAIGPISAERVRGLAMELRAKAESLEQARGLLAEFEDGGAEHLNDEEAARMALAAIELGDDRMMRRICEVFPGWTGSELAQRTSVEENPVLAALMSAQGPRCWEAIDDFHGDAWSWEIGGWPMIMWAVAARSKEAVAALLEREERDQTRAKRSGPTRSGLLWSLERSERGPARSAIALAAQMGDEDWLDWILDRAREQEELRGRDWNPSHAEDWSECKALAVALFELAQEDLRIAKGESEGTRRASRERVCRRLSEEGFEPDGRHRGQTSALGLVAAIAETDAGRGWERRLRPALELALELGSMRKPKPPRRPPRPGAHALELAGWSLDADLETRLLKAGFEPGERGCFEEGAARSLAAMAASPEQGWSGGMEIIEQLGDRKALSLAERLEGVEGWAPGAMAGRWVKALWAAKKALEKGKEDRVEAIKKEGLAAMEALALSMDTKPDRHSEPQPRRDPAALRI